MMNTSFCLHLIRQVRVAKFVWNCRHLRPIYNAINLHSRALSSNVFKTYIELLHIKHLPFTCCSIHPFSQNTNDTDIQSKEISNKTSKVHREEENEFFHKYLDKNYKQYTLGKSSIAPLTDAEISTILETVKKPSFDSKSVENVLTALNELSQTNKSSQEKLFGNKTFSSLVLQLIDLLPSMDDKTFWMSADAMASFNARVFLVHGAEKNLRMHIVQSFDKEFEKRSFKWSIQQCLKAADFFYHYRYSDSPNGKFMSLVFLRLEAEAEMLPRTDIVVALYHASLYRYASLATLRRLLSSAHKSLKRFSVEDIGMVCAGFHKSKKMVYGNIFFENLVNLTKGFIERMPDPTLSMVLKYIRRHGDKRMKISGQSTYDAIIDMQPLLASRVKYSNIQTVLHTLELYDKLRDVSQDLLAVSCQKILQEDPTLLRLKDLAKFSVILRNLAPPFAYDSGIEEVLNTVQSEIQSIARIDERQRFTHYVLVCLLALSMRGVYPHNLLQEVYGEQGIEFFKKKGIYWRDLYYLSESVRIEDPTYKGPLLSKEYAGLVLKAEHEKIKNQTESKRSLMLQSVTQCLSDTIGGRDLLKVQHLLPQFHMSDIEVHVDRFGYAVPPRDSSQEVSFLPPAQSVAVVIHGINAYYKFRTTDGRDYDSLTGLHRSKVRQLEHIGYKVLEVPYYEWESMEDKDAYIRNKWFTFNKL